MPKRETIAEALAAMPERERAQVGPLDSKDPNSIEYAWQRVAALKFLWHAKDTTDREWEAFLDEVEEEDIAGRVPPEEPYGDIDAMLLAEIGRTREQSISERTKKHGEEANVDDLMPTAGNPHSNSNNIRIRQHGTSAKYLRARIARDHPDILERMKAGEYRSVRQAAIEAGIVKVPTQLDLLRKAWGKASAKERKEFLMEVADG